MTQLERQLKLQTIHKEWTTSSLDIKSGWVLTKVDYTTQMFPKPTKKELDHMGNAEKYVSVQMENKNNASS